MDGPLPLPRHRSSTAASASSTSNLPITSDLREFVQKLQEALPDANHPPSTATLQLLADDFRAIRQILIDHEQHIQVRDAFRHADGFKAALDTLRSLRHWYRPGHVEREERIEFFELLKALLNVLSEAFNRHAGNRRYFAKRVEHGGWSALQEALRETGVLEVQDEGGEDDIVGQEQFFGCLFAFALGEESLTPALRAAKEALEEQDGEEKADSLQSASEENQNNIDVKSKMTSSLDKAQVVLRKHVSGSELLKNAEIVPIILNFWASGQLPESLSTAILLVLIEIAELSTFNAVEMYSTHILNLLLPFALEGGVLSPKILALRSLIRSLLPFGFNCLDSAQLLLQHAATSSSASELLLISMGASRLPPFVQFDLSLHGYSSIEIPTLGPRSFPPQSSAGYTFTAWLKVDKFDPDCHTTLFGAFDVSQKCFLLAYLEKDTRHFILQTSMSSSKPSVRFKTIIFEEGLWYHIALVHRRPKTTTTSKAALFVNGQFLEQIKCQYPSSPAVIHGSQESFASLSSKSSNQKSAPVQAFLGTPQDLATRLGTNVVSTRWSLASFHLLSEALSDELVTVFQKLGPRYNGNFQDCLGSFQTYQASAELNLYNELLHPGKEEQSEIVAAIKGKGSSVLPEDRILLSISPINVLDDDDRNNIDESQLIKALSKHAGRNLAKYIHSGNAIVINGAVASINDALTQSHGVGILTGEPIVAVPQALDDMIWRLDGCAPLCLKLIELAPNDDAVLRAVEITFAAVEGSWRNSEAMEKENGAGFAALMTILREKLGLGSLNSAGDTAHPSNGRPFNPTRSKEELEIFSMGLLMRILHFVGFNADRPDDSVIINPLAYRVLLLDFDTWVKMPVATQKLYYQQFSMFVEANKYRQFNAKRLIRIRIIKRLLDPLKSEPMPSAAVPDFLHTLETMLRSNTSADILRALALFITYALHDARATTIKRNRTWPPNHGSHGSETSTPPLRALEDEPMMTHAELGVRLLEMYADLLCEKENTTEIKRFAKTVTNKWLLYLLAEPSPQVVFLAAKILARLLVLHGHPYRQNFAEKSGGFTIMKQRLRNWWNMPAMWTLCFGMLFGYDVALIDFERDFNFLSLAESFGSAELKVVNPDVLPILGAMLEAGLRSILAKQQEHLKPLPEQIKQEDQQSLHPPTTRTRPRSMSLRTEQDNARSEGARTPEQRITSDAEVLHAVIHFLVDLHSKYASFRTYALSSNYVQELLFVLYPIVVTSDAVSAEMELYSRGNALNFEGKDVEIRPHNTASTQQPPVVRTSVVEPPPSPTSERATPLRRGSSFVLLTKDREKGASPQPALPKLMPVMSPTGSAPVNLQVGNALVDSLLEVIVGVFLDQILQRKEFPGFGLFLKVPPGFQEHQAYFESYVLLYAMNVLSNSLRMNQKLMTEPRVLTNVARYTLHMSEAVFEGWFMNGTEPLLDFIGTYLEFLQRPDIAQLKDVRLCGGAVATMRSVFFKVALLRLSELQTAEKTADTVSFLDKLTYWQTVILNSDTADGYWLRLICFLLYTKLVSPDNAVRIAAANYWRMLLVQKPAESSQLLNYHAAVSQKHLVDGFLGLAHTDNDAFLHWIDDHRSDLHGLFFGSMSKAWETFVNEENAKTEESAKNRVAKRKDRLRQWQIEQTRAEDVWRRHETSTPHWRHNVHAAERLKHQRALQDQQENLAFTATTLSRFQQRLEEPVSVFPAAQAQSATMWQLDESEGRNRMRLRVIKDRTVRQEAYQPKRRNTTAARNRLKLDTNVKPVSAKEMVGVTPATGRSRSNSQLSTGSGKQDEEYEIVEDPNEDEAFDDKKRRVQRSLQMNDTILSVCNVARIVGLEAIEGLLVVGKNHLYMLDDFFERSDREVVRSWQAPPEERDPYLRMISGHQQSTARRQSAGTGERSARHWAWSDVLSISKRRFLFREVGIELFFTDGRSYLLTTKLPDIRNDLYMKLIARAPQVHGSASALESEERWRLESLRNPEEVPQTIGSKFASVFNQTPSNPATRRWMRGELSNFAYLMLVNTMAGRTFNDLTQYPVFPWVLADYTSEELDLSDPRTFRDFSKPMGSQTLSRETDFRERYSTFAEMGDNNAPPFHYGTHYSSAMIVTSYLIRLQPFVQSYLLLQGGSFDHADRLFYSIEKAWLSASKDNMTDVRELTPEFFYLPDFLTNVNGYNFGSREATGEQISDVALPPWAKGDPNIFIAKNREALESPYVSAHLHKWIDLVFGFKQRGDAAVEATNVFHHLSYHGAKDLDSIQDPVERLATIGIIHNFGQTPHQVFQRAHPHRDDGASRDTRIDVGAENLTRLPFPLLESGERVSSLLYSFKQDKLFCSAAFRINIPPTYERYMEWGFADGSLRFFATDSRKLIGLFEHLHHGQISTAIFVDSKTLITAGTDCVVSVWNVHSSSKATELQPRVSFFGHRAPVTVLATSKAFSTFLSASTDGKVYLWDLNRSEFVRELNTNGQAVQCARINSVTGKVLLCCGPRVLLFSLNGQLLLEQRVSSNEDPIISCAFYEGVGNEWLEAELVFTGHSRGIVNIFKISITSDGKWMLALIKRLDHSDPKVDRNAGNAVAPAPITCILPMASVVYTGDDDGRVCEWDCVRHG
ncbi:beach-domain-containing protein [Rhizodiscina lignyota]|uniref:Beach-domain-containing protein n=1 Tax=Rhizodiscina lignyota TaxID=1504668 RepID=A0A9P4INW1_9PEZI|nr:beach-domain-containing protein [Rhizodiscina lignyota]